MRLTQGVGYEYLMSFKWLPLALAQVVFMREDISKTNITSLGFLIGFLFEGTPNIGVIGSIIVGLFYLYANAAPLIKRIFSIFVSSVVGFVFFMPKLLPGILSSFDINYSARVMWDATGWRASLISIRDFYKYFFPYNGNGVGERGFFTPGMIGVFLLLVSLFYILMNLRRSIKDKYLTFFLAVMVLGIILSIENPLSFFIWSLPLLKKITRIPSSLVFISVALPFLAVSGADVLSGIGFFKHRRDAVFVSLAILVFLEVLVGPSYFGVETYTFNFLKFKPREELKHFNYLDGIESGPVYAFTPGDMILPYYVSSMNRLINLNTTHYFLGDNNIVPLLNHNTESAISLYNLRYALSYKDLFFSNMVLRGTFDDDDFLHLERSYQMDRATLVGKWDGKMRVYENVNYDPAWKNYSSAINEFEIPYQNVLSHKDLLPLTYSSYWTGDVQPNKDAVSGLSILSKGSSNVVRLEYFPAPYYLAFTPILFLILFLLL